MRAEPVADTPYLELGEGPLWDEPAQLLRWIGIPDRRVLTLDPASGAIGSVELDVTPGTLMPYGDGGLMLATERGFERLDPATGRTTLVAAVEADRPDRRMNDGKTDPYGRPVAGSMGRGSRASQDRCTGWSATAASGRSSAGSTSPTASPGRSPTGSGTSTPPRAASPSTPTPSTAPSASGSARSTSPT